MSTFVNNDGTVTSNAARRTPMTPNTTEMVERVAICSAFDRGLSASLNGHPMATNPYMPLTEAEMAQAWFAGWQEEEGPAYRVALRPHHSTQGEG